MKNRDEKDEILSEPLSPLTPLTPNSPSAAFSPNGTRPLSRPMNSTNTINPIATHSSEDGPPAAASSSSSSTVQRISREGKARQTTTTTSNTANQNQRRAEELAERVSGALKIRCDNTNSTDLTPSFTARTATAAALGTLSSGKNHHFLASSFRAHNHDDNGEGAGARAALHEYEPKRRKRRTPAALPDSASKSAANHPTAQVFE